MALIVGLGNPGKDYLNTRHNAGFMAIERLSSLYKFALTYKSKFHAEFAAGYGPHDTGKLLLARPTTFMNLSGKAVAAICSYYQLETKNLYVIHDDVDLELGKVKYKFGGSSSGHNGLKSLDSYLGNQYHRVRVGIGRPNFNKIMADYVLEKFNDLQQQQISRALQIVADNFWLILTGNLVAWHQKLLAEL